MAKINLNFAVNGSVSQRIKILTDETPEEFFKQIKDGNYFTSISTKDVISLNLDSTGEHFEKVGIVEEQATLDDTECSDLDMENE